MTEESMMATIIRSLLLCFLTLSFAKLALGQQVVQMQKSGGVYTVPCKVNGLELRFIFDTGASDVSISISEAIFMLKNGYMSKDDLIGTEYYQIANGEILEGTKLNISSLEIGGKVLRDVRASVTHTLDAPLLLGQSVLERFGKYSVNYDNLTLTLGEEDLSKSESNEEDKGNNEVVNEETGIKSSCELRLMIVPDGAAVSVNDKSLSGESPFLINLPEGNHKLRIEKSGFWALDTVVILNDELTEIFTRLLPQVKMGDFLPTPSVKDMPDWCSGKSPLEKAYCAFYSHQYYPAIILYKKAYVMKKEQSNKANIIYYTAICYREVGDSMMAETWFRKAVRIKYPDPKIHLYYADALRSNGKFSEAIAEYEEYHRLVPDDPRGKNGTVSCELAQTWLDNPSRYVVENEVQLNTQYSDYCPSYLTKDHRSITFSSSRDEGNRGKLISGRTGQKYPDVYTSRIDNYGKWSKPKGISKSINTEGGESAFVMRSAFDQAYFSRDATPNILSAGNDETDSNKPTPTHQIYQSTSYSNEWRDVKPVLFSPESRAKDFNILQPALSNDGQTMVFVSDAPGGKGGLDLWVSTYNQGRHYWNTPVNLSAVNTEGDEVYPFIHAGDKTLYFSSDGYIGMGGLDIYMAEFQGDYWNNVTNMQFPINSLGDDFAIVFQKQYEKGYFTSNRSGGKGSHDIYSFLLPALKFTLCGTVSDFKTKKIIPGATVALVGTDGSSLMTTTDSDGRYCFDLSPATSYVITAGKKGYYLNKTGKTTTVGFEEDKDLIHDFELDVKLQPKVDDRYEPNIIGKSSGSGFAISSNGIIVTNHHVVDGAKSIKVRGVKSDFSKTYNAKVLISDKNNDLALIQIDEHDFTSLGTIPYTIKTGLAGVGEDVFVLGYPLIATMGDEIKLTNGIVSSQTGFQGDISSYQVSAPIQPGNSGGPVFDGQGNLIGIINAKHVGAENATYSVKTSYLSNLTDLLPSRPNFQTFNSLKGKTLTQQVQLAKEFVYIIEVE